LRHLALVLVAVALALAASACSSGSDSSAQEQPGPAQDTTPAPTGPARHFEKSELPQLVLQPSDAPPGMSYTKKESGAKSLDALGFVLEDELAEIRTLRLRGVRDAIFDAQDHRSRLSSRIWLFAQPKGAVAWLEKSRNDAVRFAFEPVESPSLAEASWGARGVLSGLNVLTYAFRSGNVVVVVSMYAPKANSDTDSSALAAARRAADRLRAS
jgi:hypothetical protein